MEGSFDMYVQDFVRIFISYVQPFFSNLCCVFVSLHQSLLKKLVQKKEALTWKKKIFTKKIYKDGHFLERTLFYSLQRENTLLLSNHTHSLFTQSYSLTLLLSFFLYLLVLLAWFTNEDHNSQVLFIEIESWELKQNIFF